MKFPQLINQFTPSSMNEVLSNHLAGNKVSCIHVEPHQWPGQIADVFRVQVDYLNPTDLPKHFVAKVSAANPGAREIGANFGMYERETAFYREFLEPGISTPNCYFAEFCEASHDHLLLLEDLSPAESPSWGCTLEHVAEAVEAIAKFHLKWWNDETLLARQWLDQLREREGWRKGISSALSKEGKLRECVSKTRADYTVSVVGKVAEKFSAFWSWAESRNFTLVHGDYHTKQIFFPSESGGRFAVIDWQCSMVATGAHDFCRVVGWSLPIDIRRAHKPRLQERYADTLAAAGGRIDYSVADLVEDSNFSHMVNLLDALIVADSDPYRLNREIEKFDVSGTTNFLERVIDSVVDSGFDRFIDRL